MKKHQLHEKKYRVYVNQRPHLPAQAGRKLFFEASSHKEAVIFSEKLVGTMVEWFLEDYRFYGSRNYDVIETLRNFVVNFWIEPIDDAPLPGKPFCAKRHATKLLEPHTLTSSPRSRRTSSDSRHKLTPSVFIRTHPKTNPNSNVIKTPIDAYGRPVRNKVLHLSGYF